MKNNKLKIIAQENPQTTNAVGILNKSEKKMRDYIISISGFPNQNPNGVISVSKRGAVLYANPAGKEMMIRWKDTLPTQIKKLVAGIPMSAKQHKFEATIDKNTYYIGLSPIKEMGYVNIYLIDITERKKTEEKYQALVEVTDTGYVILDSHGVALDANSEYARLTGRPISEVIGHNIFEWTAKYDMAKNIEGFNKCIKHGFIRNFEIDYADEQGNSIPIEVNANVISSGDDYKIITLCRDISERKKNDELRVKQERRMRAIIDNSPLGVHEYTLQTDGKLIFTGYNPAANLILGVDHKQFIGQTIETAFPALKKTNIPAEYRKVANTGRNYENVNVSYSQGKISGAFEIVAFQTAPMCVTIFFRDITDRKKTEEKLIENQRILKDEQKIAGIGTYVLDIQTGIWESSEMLDKIFGIDKNHQHTLKGWVDILYPDDREMMITYFQDYVLKKHNKFDKEYRIIRANDGEVRWLHGYGDLDIGHGGKPTKMIGAIMDITERKNKEEKLNMLKSTIDVASDAAYWMDKNGRFVYANESGYKMLGYTEKELLKLSVFDVNTKVTKKRWGNVWKIIRNKKKYVSESIHIRKDGSEVPVEIASTYFVFDGKEYINGFARDISARKRTEEEILLKNALLSAQNEATIEGVLAIDPKGKMISNNQRFAQMWNIPDDIIKTNDDKKMLGVAIKQLKKPEKFMKEVQSLYKQTTRISIDEIEFKDGRVFSRYTSPLKNSLGKHIGRIWFFTDITEVKNAEHKIKISEERFRGIFNSSRDAIITLEPPTWRLTSANPAAVSMFACTGEKEFIGKNPNRCSSPKQPDGLSSPEGIKLMIGKAMKEGSALFEWTFRRKNGENFPSTVLLNRVKAGGKTFIQATIRDITRLKRIEKSKMELISLASHQLRTPPTGVKWYAGMLIDGDAGRINNQQRSYLQEIMRNNQRMIDLVHSLLSASRIELGKFTPKPERVQISKVIDDVMEELGVQMADKKLHFKTQFINKIPTLMSDPGHLRIIIFNVLNNSIKYTPDRGLIKLSVKKRGRFIDILIADSGYGIPKHQQNQIFTKFFRADNVSTETSGSGLGLYIVKSLINSMGGEIHFKSRLKRGTVFTLSVPIKCKI